MTPRAASLAALLALALAAPAAAQINLSWDDCGLAGQQVKTWACDANPDVVGRFYVSFVVSPALNLTTLTGAETVIYLQAAGGVLPPWWQMGTTTSGSCRPNGIAVEFTTPCASAQDYWGTVPGGVLGGFGYYYGSSPPGMPPGMARLKIVQAVDGAQAGAPAAGENYLCTIALKGTGTTGSGSCAGCGTPIGILLNSIVAVQPAGMGDAILTSPADRQWVAWECGFLGEYWSFGYDCLTPATRPTWGQVKALYR